MGQDNSMLNSSEQKFPGESLVGSLKPEASVSEFQIYEIASKKLAFLFEASAILTSSLDFETSLTRVTALTVPALADCSLTFILKSDGKLYLAASAFSDDDTRTLASLLFQTASLDFANLSFKLPTLKNGQPLLAFAPDFPMLESVFQSSEELNRLGVNSVILAPLIVIREQPLGLIVLLNINSERKYTEADLPLVQGLARQMALVTENAQLHREVKAALQARDETMLMFDSFLEAAPVGIAYLDKDLNYLKVNQAMAELNGLTVEQHIGRAMSDIVPLAEQTLGATLRQVLQSGKYLTGVEFSASSPNAKTFQDHWLGSFYPVGLLGQEARGIGVIMVKITAMKNAEKALRQSEQRFRQLAETLTSAVFIIYENKCLYANRASELLTGYSVSELYEMVIWDILSSGSVEEFKASILPRIGADRVIKASEFTLTTKSGEIRWAYSNNSLIEYEGVSAILAAPVDITAQKKAQKALEQSEERFSKAFHYAPSAMTISDKNSRFVDVNNTFLQGMGFQREEVIGHTGEELNIWVDKEDRNKFIATLQALGSVRDLEVSLRSKAGNILIGLMSGEVLLLDGEPFLISTLVDITERKQAEAALRQSEERLRHSMRMEAIGTLAGGVAHDFNNLLTTISGYTEFLLASVGEEGPLREDVLEIKKASERAAALTRQLLAFSRKQIMQPKVLDLNLIVSEMNRMLRRLIPENINLYTVLQPELHLVETDPGQIEQVILNLVVNSRDAMPNGGKLIIETRNVELDETYASQHISVVSGSYVLLAVSDSGKGMDSETEARIFEPFFTTKEQGKGTGLGLSMVYGIVKQSGGTIWVYSEPEQGTTFKIYLPIVVGQLKPSKNTSLPQPVQSGKETILLVEDDEMVRRMTSKILRRAGYEVLEAANGAKALLKYQETQGEFDLLLTDVVMPDLSGRDLAEQLTLVRPDLRVLFMSGYTDTAIVHHGVLDRNTAFIQKPFTQASLTAKVREVLDNRSGQKS